MSIWLTELLELSHDLCHARKRRSEWEFREQSHQKKKKKGKNKPRGCGKNKTTGNPRSAPLADLPLSDPTDSGRHIRLVPPGQLIPNPPPEAREARQERNNSKAAHS